jgi:AraC-like DNA-binding protein
LLVAQQLAYTAASILLFMRRPEPADRSSLGFWWPTFALSIIVGIHFGQLARFSPWGAQLQDAVPVIGAGGALAMLLAALILPHQPTSKRAAYAKSALGEGRARMIFEEAVAVVEGEKLFRRYDLTLGDVALRINASPHHLSQALSIAGKTSFKELVTGLRVNEARRLLSEPANANVAVEPLGMEAGFRSRSAFYAAFSERIGLTPADFRKRLTASVSGPTGQDTDFMDEPPRGP